MRFVTRSLAAAGMLAALSLGSSCAPDSDGAEGITGPSTSLPPTSALVASVTDTTNFAAIMRGIRPRGFGAVPYALRAPSSGGRVWYVSPSGQDAAPGTSAQPLRTINRAAALAVAGDVVTIGPGTYDESVVVQNSGTAQRPIVFQAAVRGTVVLTGGNHVFTSKSWTSGVLPTGQFYVTVRGLVFWRYSDPLSTVNAIAAVQASTGWVIEEDLFDEAGRTGAELRGHYIRVQRSTFQRNYVNALMAWGDTREATSVTDSLYTPILGLRIRDVIIRWNNTTPTPLTGDSAEYVAKIWGTRGAEIDNLESYENNGPGLWLDTRNSKYYIRNSYFHGNGPVADVASRGRGVFIERNWDTGLIERSVFLDNSGAAVTVANSSRVEVRYSLMSGNAYCVALLNSRLTLNDDGTPRYPLQYVYLRNNRCRDWKLSGGVATVGGTFGLPSAMHLRSDSTVYEPVTDPAIVRWPGIGPLTTIEQVRQLLGWEMHGAIGTVTVPTLDPAP